MIRIGWMVAFSLPALLACSSTPSMSTVPDANRMEVGTVTDERPDVGTVADEGTDLVEAPGSPDKSDALMDAATDAGRCCPVGYLGGLGTIFEGGWSPTGSCPDAGIFDPGCDCSIVKDAHGCDILQCLTPF